MGIQKSINTRLIKLAIGKKYVYEIEAEEKANSIIKKTLANTGNFLKDGINEMKKEIGKGLGE